MLIVSGYDSERSIQMAMPVAVELWAWTWNILVKSLLHSAANSPKQSSLALETGLAVQSDLRDWTGSPV